MIKIGKSIIKKSLEIGLYKAIVMGVAEGSVVELKGGIKQPTVVVTFELDVDGNKLEKEKVYIASTMVGSELRTLIDNLLPEKNIEEDGIDLSDLLGTKCELEIVIKYSKRGNRYENIGQVNLRDLEDEVEVAV